MGKSFFSPPKPSVILFDFDNTLYPYDPCNIVATRCALEIASNRFNLPFDEVQNSFNLARNLVKERVGCVAARHSRLLYFHCMLEELGLGSQVEEALRLEQIYWRSYLIHMELFPYAAEFLANLRSYGIRLGLVTDLTAQIQFRKLLALGLSSTFDAVVTSEEVNGEKETGAPYLLMSQKMALGKDDNVWMVGDSDADITGSKTYLNAFTICMSAGISEIPLNADAVFADFFNLNKAVDMVFKNA